MFAHTSNISCAVWGFALLLLCLGLRQHFQGKNEAWGYPVTTYPWFQPGGKLKPAGLPSPVTQRDRRGTQPLSPYTVEDRRRNFQERGRTGRPENSHVRGKSSTSQKDGVKGRAKEYKARRDRDGMTPIYDKYYRSASPRR